MRRFVWLLGALACLTGCAASRPHTLGVAPPATAAITPVRALKPSGVPVTVKGTMVEKCPISGCWFKLRDGSGEITVDTNAAGFVVAEVPVNTTVTVRGTLPEGPDPRLAASGVSY